MKVFITPQGDLEAVYSDALVDLKLGPMEIKRASEVEFNHEQKVWEARDGQGKLIAVGRKRAEVLALEAEAIEKQLRKSL